MSFWFDSDSEARVESYFQAYHELEGEDGTMDMFASGRYLDSFELRDGQWRLTHRQAVYDWNMNQASTQTWDQSPVQEMLIRGEQGKGDLSFNKAGFSLQQKSD